MRGVRWIGRLCKLPRQLIIIVSNAGLSISSTRIRRETRVFCRLILRFFRILKRIARMHKLQLLRHIDPCRILAKRLSVPVEVLLTAWALFSLVHRRVLLVAEGQAGGGRAYSVGFLALCAYRLLF